MHTHKALMNLEVSQEDSSNIIIRVPTALKHRLKVDAAMRGITMRSIILEALLEVGYEHSYRRVKGQTHTPNTSEARSKNNFNSIWPHH